LSRRVLNISREGDSTTFLGSLFQCFVKKNRSRTVLLPQKVEMGNGSGHGRMLGLSQQKFPNAREAKRDKQPHPGRQNVTSTGTKPQLLSLQSRQQPHQPTGQLALPGQSCSAWLYFPGSGDDGRWEMGDDGRWGMLSSALLSSRLPSHMDTWSISSSSPALDHLKARSPSLPDGAGAADQRQTRHPPKDWQLPALPARTLCHQRPGPAVPAVGRGWEADRDSDSRRCLGLTQTLERRGRGILPE